MKHDTPEMEEHIHTRNPLVGWWRLLSCEIEFRDSGRREPMYATDARGYIYFGAEGRMITVIEATGRERPTDRNGFADAFLASAAYTGRYRLDGDRWTTRVDVAWNPWWTDTDQERMFRLESGQLHVESAWYSSPMHANQWVRACLSWTRGD
jgi:hypothetical protein